MKIIASEENEHYRTVYLCEVTHDEIEKFLNKYYRQMDKLKRGDVIDLGNMTFCKKQKRRWSRPLRLYRPMKKL